jgi:putative ATP-dependent endonuclease of OLD family
MQLSEVVLSNFRSCRDTAIQLSPDLTVVVGENASGKSALIDALRLSTFSANGRATSWFAANRDLNRHVDAGEPVSVTNRFEDLTSAEKSVYLSHLVDADDELRHSTSFATARDVPRRSVTSFSIGSMHTEDPEPGLRSRISHVYLPPLRDAVRDLDGRDQTQLAQVFELIMGSEDLDEDEFVEAAGSALKTISEHPVATTTTGAIQDYFGRTTPPDRAHRVGIDHQELELRRIVRLLRLQLAEQNVPLGDIASTGLGYANLLYISMIVLQLVKAKESDLTLLLVEEPEAHLHPQLQVVFLDFLREQARTSGIKASSVTESTGKVQVIVTTHSPVLASSVSVRNVVVLARDGAEQWSTKSTALTGLGLGEIEVRKLDRYLHATRAAVLFSRNIVLVEGAAEHVLVPVLARRQLGSGKVTSTGLRQFLSASVISVEGVDFQPFLDLLLRGEHSRVDRVVVITDGDDGAGATRRKTYEALFPEALADGRLRIEVGASTLEAEMFAEPANEQLLKLAYDVLRPQSDHHWKHMLEKADGLVGGPRAAVFARALAATKKIDDEVYLDIAKGEFAHLVAEALELPDQDVEFVVPAYLARAIDAAAHVSPGPSADD